MWSRDIFERAVKTFFQAAIASLPVTIHFSPDALEGVVWGALTAGLAALVSLMQNLQAEGQVVEATRRATTAMARQPMRPQIVSAPASTLDQLRYAEPRRDA